MAKIGSEDKERIKELFSENLEGDVNIHFFTDGDACEYCEDTREILDEISSLDDRINLTVNNLGEEEAERLGINRAPAIVFVDDEGEDLGVHFYGIPSGYEFNTLIEDIIDISNNGPRDLGDDIKEQIKAIDKDVRLQVFITPTCPYCPRAVRVAHQMAMLNPKVRGEMIEAIEFRDLSEKYNVSGVPKTVINDGAAEQVGAVPAQVILNKIKEV
ncbi:protein disulfide oxidoreductase [Halothermothrix orenii]|uniref:Glutaredoxin-like domain protein n=1 Tax=Halothermothrix orenii (strain H 168 / OCM 544 / DSM 9562) TaxID=373903 RepID=B8CZ43_HALOH|nr:glutaredoxin-like domain protein [Halothermothrix orenii H 168]